MQDEVEVLDEGEGEEHLQHLQRQQHLRQGEGEEGEARLQHLQDEAEAEAGLPELG